MHTISVRRTRLCVRTYRQSKTRRERKATLKERKRENEGKTKKKSHFFGFLHSCYQLDFTEREFLMKFH